MWATTFEHARSHRVDESGEWLLAHPLVAGLIEDSSAATARRPNVLFLYGKPGYGKTTLATVVIDHLRDTASLRGKNGPGSLAFFFFDRQGRFNSSHDAFRALLAQLIFCRRFDRIVLDIAAITRSDHDTGQQLASDDEVFAILHLFLLQFSNCAFVCDGVDECKDRDNFLKRLIEDLVEGGELVLLGATSVDDLTSSICTRSNGMFLWAALFLGYLKLPSLSISQRREALEDSHKFEEYPLFAYAAQSWTSHLREVTDQFATSSYVDSLCIFEELGQRAILFLSNKLKFTSWTEALWHMSCPQEAWAMESVDWKRIDSIYNDSEIKTAASLLHLAFEEHRGLVKSWGNVLQKYPEELWQPSISAFSESMLRKTTTAAETTSILHNSTGGQDSTVLQTKCSSSGHAIGILRAQYQSK
ncbi:uncharacterized protein K460DRAFT_282847 [Cucurbitaria berberidis CBS 394.84]|uniref:Nephrocystin 3-like N-terminal domain-containing protein n=1 Tax=Cucurbitaria berberidis CBS 394.84 TaxID=1168544 RepID=A0A9P4L9E0_9PLEO|nr:uncharacterized protein K460DRAFT_282847 [Cucurbitaria berberidis CBS 394.84]KAF1846338.1 hypothetical protein K460DRAFT_282847 [Cucurbitaria berberidis CBS 394.84]